MKIVHFKITLHSFLPFQTPQSFHSIKFDACLFIKTNSVPNNAERTALPSTRASDYLRAIARSFFSKPRQNILLEYFIPRQTYGEKFRTVPVPDLGDQDQQLQNLRLDPNLALCLPAQCNSLWPVYSSVVSRAVNHPRHSQQTRLRCRGSIN
jgi:hypothetical protein